MSKMDGKWLTDASLDGSKKLNVLFVMKKYNVKTAVNRQGAAVRQAKRSSTMNRFYFIKFMIFPSIQEG